MSKLKVRTTTHVRESIITDTLLDILLTPPQETPPHFVQDSPQPPQPSYPDVLQPYEIFWCEHFRWLQSCGYLLRKRYMPGWIPSFGPKSRGAGCEDAKYHLVRPASIHLFFPNLITDLVPQHYGRHAPQRRCPNHAENDPQTPAYIRDPHRPHVLLPPAVNQITQSLYPILGDPAEPLGQRGADCGHAEAEDVQLAKV